MTPGSTSLAATLDYSPTGGGVLSFVDDIWGGYTIANGVVIENATGGGGNDILIGNAVANVLTGNNGDDTAMGRAGNDQLNGGNGNDALDGGDNNDTLSGGNHDDTLSGGAGVDSLDGGNHADDLNGGDDNDTLSGGNHDDVLNGDAGNDVLNGGNHSDSLNGGSGNDVMTGGNQSDLFVVSETGGADRILDFNRGQGDKIDLSDIDAVAGGADNAFAWIGAAAFSGVAGQLRSYSSGGNNFLAGDVNGDSVADFTVQTNIVIIQTDLMFA